MKTKILLEETQKTKKESELNVRLISFSEGESMVQEKNSEKLGGRTAKYLF